MGVIRGDYGSGPPYAVCHGVAVAPVPDHPRDADTGTGADARAVVQAAVGAIGKAGTVSASAVADAVEGAARGLVHRVVATAVADPREVDDERALVQALSEKSVGPTLGGATAAALAARAASRARPLRFLTRRTPMWLVAAAVPALYASVTRGAHELGLVAAHLARRARAAGVEPDVDAVRRVTVELLLNRPVDPHADPSYGAVAVRWLRRAFRAALPFTAGVATADPKGLAKAAARVPVSHLARASDRPALGR